MDQDPNDILFSNTYIPEPNLNPNNTQNSTDEFRKYYEQELKKQDEEKLNKKLESIDLKNITNNVQEDSNSLLNSNRFDSNDIGPQNTFKRFKREHSTFINIDSRDRDKILYPKASYFKIFLAKSYYNVRSIRLASMEFPNTDAVINSNNNNIYWRNKQDIDLDFTVTTNGIVSYPVYTVQLRIGSYIASSLGSEIINEMNLIRRTQGSSSLSSTSINFHYFIVSLDISTDIVTFTSLILQQLPNNPFSTTVGNGVIIINAPNHGYKDLESIYIIGAKAMANIPVNNLTGFFNITFINTTTFSIEITVNAGATIIAGGGNTVQSGKKTPFQLLWGEYSNTVAQNIGYPLEDSFEQIYTNINSLTNIYQMVINLTTPHNFINTYNYIGKTVNIGYFSGILFLQYQSFQIINIPSSTSILVQVSSKSLANTLNNNSSATNIQFILPNFSIVTFATQSFSNYLTDTFLITTTTNHNYTLNNIGNYITLYNTFDSTILNDTNFDGTYQIYGLPSTTSIILAGVLTRINVHPSGNYGNIPRQTPLTSNTLIINSIIIHYLNNLSLIYIKCSSFHNLITGDSIQIFNVVSDPLIINKTFIITVIDQYSFTINFQISTIDYTNINNSSAYIGTGLITVSFPSHSFNTILNIIVVSGTIIKIQTLLPHNLTSGNIIRLSGTNTTPKLDGSYVLTVVANDTFTIVASSVLTNIPSTITGILGLSNNFYLYGVNTIGNISESVINNILFSVRKIIDKDTFTFMINNSFATKTEIGGGSNIFISSLKHGFNGIQTNTKNNLLNRSINLEGENYCFLVCPQLNTMNNTGSVTNIFARISLDQSPGYVCFNFLSNPKIFDTVPLSILSELEFYVLNYDGSRYIFNDLDFSFCLEIVEIIDQTDAFNISSKRGISDIADSYISSNTTSKLK